MLSRRTIIVTGAAGALGHVLVRRLAADGATVIGVGHTHDMAELGQAAFYGGVDLTDGADTQNAYATIAKRHGAIDGLANIAGGFSWETLSGGSPDTWDRMFAINVKTTLNSCRAALPLMSGRNASIVNVGAAGAVRAGQGMGAYAASKSGVMRLTEALAEECKADGPRVNAVLPSIIDTEANRRDMPDEAFSRWVSPESLAGVIAFLLSDAAEAMTGALVPVTGRV